MGIERMIDLAADWSARLEPGVHMSESKRPDEIATSEREIAESRSLDSFSVDPPRMVKMRLESVDGAEADALDFDD